jgi:ribonuclease P protein component
MAKSDPQRASGDERARFPLPRQSRLLGRSDYVRVFRRAARHSAQGFALYAAPNDLGRNRFGVSIGRKHGKAVVRNRTRRLLKEAFRLENAELPQGFDFVCIPAQGPTALSLTALRALLVELAQGAARKSTMPRGRPGGPNRRKQKGRESRGEGPGDGGGNEP